jgi:hypothetical protein
MLREIFTKKEDEPIEIEIRLALSVLWTDISNLLADVLSRIEFHAIFS